jgi:hypothetical protein
MFGSGEWTDLAPSYVIPNPAASGTDLIPQARDGTRHTSRRGPSTEFIPSKAEGLRMTIRDHADFVRH